MRLEHPLRHARTAAIAAAIVASSVSAFGQTGQSSPDRDRQSAAHRPCPAAAARRSGGSRSTTPSSWALEQNLGIQIQRLDPQIQDTAIAQARSFWAPQFSTTLTRASNAAAGRQHLLRQRSRASRTGSFSPASGSAETLPWGANYTANWNNSRFTTNDPSNTFNPRAQSNLLLNFNQPLLRNLDRPDSAAVANSRKFRDLSDIQLDSVIVQTTRARAQRLLGSLGDDQQPQSPAGVAGAGATVARRQPQTGRDRHAGADRHRPGAGRSREQRGARDRRRSADQAGAGQPARADSRRRPPPTSGRRRSSRATTRRSRSRRSTSTPRCETRSTGGPTCESAKNSHRTQRPQHQVSAQSDAAGHQRAGELRRDRRRRRPAAGAQPVDRRASLDRRSDFARLRVGARRRVPQLVSAVDLRPADRLSARRERGARQPRARAARIPAVADPAEERRAAGRHAGPRRRAAMCRPTRSACSRRARRANCRRRSSRRKRRSRRPACRPASSSSRRSAISRRRAPTEIQAIADYNKSLVDFEAVQLAPLNGSTTFVNTAGQQSIQTGNRATSGQHRQHRRHRQHRYYGRQQQ